MERRLYYKVLVIIVIVMIILVVTVIVMIILVILVTAPKALNFKRGDIDWALGAATHSDLGLVALGCFGAFRGLGFRG